MHDWKSRFLRVQPVEPLVNSLQTVEFFYLFLCLFVFCTAKSPKNEDYIRFQAQRIFSITPRHIYPLYKRNNMKGSGNSSALCGSWCRILIQECQHYRGPNSQKKQCHKREPDSFLYKQEHNNDRSPKQCRGETLHVRELQRDRHKHLLLCTWNIVGSY